VPGVGLPWPSLLAFARLVSNPRIFERPISIVDAWTQVEEWLDCPVVWSPAPNEHHRDVVRGLIPAVGNRPNLIPDAHLAALAIEHGLTLCSTDGDFARFPGLSWENPLAA
jgi:toxin-antitoxin system PIN domain toxin